MNHINQGTHREVQKALKDLGTLTAANLQAFNDAVPYNSWLRRSEIERFTVDLMRAAERASQRRRLTFLEYIKHVFRWTPCKGPSSDYVNENGGAIAMKRSHLNRHPEQTFATVRDEPVELEGHGGMATR